MTAMTLTEFLLARIAEEADIAEHAKWAMQGEWFTTADDKVDEFVRHVSPARVLDECEAKRRIVEEHGVLVLSGSWQYPEARCQTCAGWEDADHDGPPLIELPCPTLRLLALPYADHRDYDETWRP